MRMLQEEGGVTEISLSNIEKLKEKHGDVKFVFHSMYGDDPYPNTEIYFQDGFKWTATGFSTGYRGEGPRGLEKVINSYLDRTDIDIDVIGGLDANEGATCHLFTRGQGVGKAIMCIPAVMDGEYDIEVY